MTSQPEHQPTWRKPAGMFAILAIITVWGLIVSHFSATIGTWPFAVQMVTYAIAGIVWILPLKPLLQWMETGRWTPPDF
jgi:hypothetical protein